MSFSSVAEYSFTGMVTRPKEMAPFQIERGMASVCPCAPNPAYAPSPGRSAGP